MMDKIQPLHLRRKAILYIRQSSVFQVAHNVESQKLQYAMRSRLEQLGWQQVEVIVEQLTPLWLLLRSAGLVATSRP